MGKILTYEQAITLGKLEDKVKNHIKDNYPDKYYHTPGNILGRYGHSMSNTGWIKVSKLSKNDSILKGLMQDYNNKRQEIESL